MQGKMMDGVDFDWTDAGSPEDHADKLEVISEYAGNRGRYRQATELHAAAQCIRGLAEENDCLNAENEALRDEYQRDLTDGIGIDRSQDTDWLRAGFLQRGTEIERLEAKLDDLDDARTALEEAVGQFEAEADELREALAGIVACWDGPKYKHFMAPRIDTARAILSKHYGTEGDQCWEIISSSMQSKSLRCC